ncbi:hypothetical protein GCM10011533_16280 [Streptosporangium jomthongense]|nr:hypothetical protein GCM10011533_16280 [Streptosporangium jomthongense]
MPYASSASPRARARISQKCVRLHSIQNIRRFRVEEIREIVLAEGELYPKARAESEWPGCHASQKFEAIC